MIQLTSCASSFAIAHLMQQVYFNFKPFVICPMNACTSDMADSFPDALPPCQKMRVLVEMTYTISFAALALALPIAPKVQGVPRSSFPWGFSFGFSFSIR